MGRTGAPPGEPRSRFLFRSDPADGEGAAAGSAKEEAVFLLLASDAVLEREPPHLAGRRDQFPATVTPWRRPRTQAAVLVRLIERRHLVILALRSPLLRAVRESMPPALVASDVSWFYRWTLDLDEAERAVYGPNVPKLACGPPGPLPGGDVDPSAVAEDPPTPTDDGDRERLLDLVRIAFVPRSNHGQGEEVVPA